MTYPQQQPWQQGGHPGGYGYGGYGGYGPPPPPPTKNTGAVVLAVLAVLTGLGITGFVAPGFFLPDDEKSTAGNGGGPTSAPDGGDVDALVEKLVAAADEQDGDTLRELSCSDAEQNVQDAIRDIDEVSGVELSSTEEVSDDEVKVLLEITVNGDAGSFEALVVRSDAYWCWQDITLQGATDDTTGRIEPDGDGTEGATLIGDFVEAVNAGDTATATGMLCPASSAQTDLTNAITGKAALEVNQSTLTSDPYYAGADLTGTLNGEPVTVGRTSAFSEPEGWCILTFYVY
jgi:hypothetical protein